MGGVNYDVKINGKSLRVCLERKGSELYACIDNKRFPVHVNNAADQSIVTVNLAGIDHSLALTRDRNGYSAISSGRVFDIRLERSAVNELRKHLKSLGSGTGNAGEVKSQMPGLIVKIEVELGQAVSAGDSLLVIEAMKMENEIRAPHDGIVEKIVVESGIEIKGGQLLCIVRPDSKEE
jgi:biotin carboxyl carrier protein